MIISLLLGAIVICSAGYILFLEETGGGRNSKLRWAIAGAIALAALITFLCVTQETVAMDTSGLNMSESEEEISEEVFISDNSVTVLKRNVDDGSYTPVTFDGDTVRIVYDGERAVLKTTEYSFKSWTRWFWDFKHHDTHIIVLPSGTALRQYQK